MKFTTVLTTLSVAAVASATAPACLLAALGKQADPSDVSALCDTYQSAMLGNITEVCGSDAEDAYTSYADTCKSAGVTVASLDSSDSSDSNNGTSTSSGSTSSGSSNSSSSSTSSSSNSSSSSSSGSDAASLGNNIGPSVAVFVSGLMAAAVLL